MPLLGFGTASLLGQTCIDCVSWALLQGYRLLDTATMYFNEEQVGEGLRASGVRREDVFVTSKLPPEHVGRERRTLEESLRALRLEYLDLWLVHWPPGGEPAAETWRELVRARDEGLVRSIGVSNYSLDQVDVLTASTGVTPAVNQVPWSPRQFDPDVLTGHRERDVVLQGYSPLSSGSLTAEPVRKLAERHGVTPTQVVLRWHLQHRVATIPRSANRDHITANRVLDGFDLSPTELVSLDALGS